MGYRCGTVKHDPNPQQPRIAMQITVDPCELAPHQLRRLAAFLATWGDDPEAAPLVVANAHASGEPGALAGLIKIISTIPAADSPDAGIPSPAAVVTQHATDTLMSGAAEAAAAFGNPEPANVPQVPAVPQTPAAVFAEAVTNAISAAPDLTDLDKDGLPWDSRIHSGGKSKTKDGAWRKKSGVHDAFVAEVTAELRKVMGAPSVPPVPQATPAPVVIPPVPQATPAPVALMTLPIGTPAPVVIPPVPQATLAPAIVPPVPQATPAPAIPSAPDADPKAPWTAMLMRVATAVQAGKITPKEPDAISAKYGVPALPLLVNRLDLVPAVAAEVDALIASRG